MRPEHALSMTASISLVIFFQLCLPPTVIAATLYVDVNNAAPIAPYTNWVTAATNIQDAVDAAAPSDTVLVTNGVYQTGGRVVYGSLTNRLVVTKPVTVQSVNGPAVTIIQGYWTATTNGDTAVRCVYLTNNAALIGFTMTKGATRMAGIDTKETGGGGVYCESSQVLLSNCVLVANSASFSYGVGGGAVSGTLVDCRLNSNLAVAGGAAYNAILSNCTVTANTAVASSTGGGLYRCTANNCVLAGNMAAASGGSGGAAATSALTDCVITNNSADGGGGTFNSTLLRCIVSGNTGNSGAGGIHYGAVTDCLVVSNLTAGTGGGAYSCSLTNCTVTDNRAGGSGGGAYIGTLYNCVVSLNHAGGPGGGLASSSVINCIVSDNFALSNGGGVSGGTILNSAIIRNRALLNGGGAYGGTLTNCTLAGNSSASGGGADTSTLNNSIVYHNDAISGANYNASVLSFCCTVPAALSGVGNITDEPQLADAFHLSPGSPCRAAGSGFSTSGTDMDGEAWALVPSIGCDEYFPGQPTGTLQVTLIAGYTNLAAGAVGTFTARISGRATANTWDFGDGTVVSNQPYTTHSWASAGDYHVVATAFNDSEPSAVSDAVIVHVVDTPVQYVALGNATPTSPYLSWASAATNLQDALDAAFAGGKLILVSNGVYRCGGKSVTGGLSNRVAVTQPTTVRSVNGPSVTFIEGSQVPGTLNGDSAVRCVYLASGAVLSGFTLTNGATRSSGPQDLEMSGGGVWCQSTNAVLSNCVLVANACLRWGAGAYSGTLLNCEVSGNTNLDICLAGGAGAAFSRLLNCKVSGNRASPSDGGGALSCYLSNCVVSGNYDVGASQSTLDNCLVTANNGRGLNGGVANHCTISSNALPAVGSAYGGGAMGAALTNCVLYANSAAGGGAAYKCGLSFCTLSNNSARLGGAVYLDGSGAATIGDCTFSANAANDSGGGMYAAAVPIGFTLTRCTFSGNSASNNGGGIAFSSSCGKLTGCTFTTNRAGANGGAIYFSGTMSGTISNCSFYSNAAGTWGGGTYYASLTQCLLAGNQAAKGGGVSGGALTGCTLSTNAATAAGGGAWNGVLQFCALDGNQAGDGGGAHSANLMDCTLVNNSAITNGGGAYGSALRNCLMTGNAANVGGGAFNSSLYNCTVVGNTATNSAGGVANLSSANCIIYYNTAPTASNYAASLIACCATPLYLGLGNISNAPAFVDLPGGNFRLQTNSPCINKGNNSSATGYDLDGRTRIVGGTVDMGAYEFQGAGMSEFTAWLQQYGLPVDGSADYLDSDRDGCSNWQEWVAGTVPTNAASALAVQPLVILPPGVTITWASVADRLYSLERATNLLMPLAFTILQSNIPALPGTTSFLDTNPAATGPIFYRVGVQP
jgi:parallel beta-helix repeat protein